MNNERALILIDIQKGFDDVAYWGGHRNNPSAEQNASALLSHWREKKWPVFHVKHNSVTPGSRLAPGLQGNEFNELVRPIGSEPVIEKNVNSAFIGTDLKDRLDQAKIKSAVIAGLTTDHCVSTRARMAANLGYETFVVSDATATFDRVSSEGKRFSAEIIHETALASLDGEFATIISTKDISRL